MSTRLRAAVRLIAAVGVLVFATDPLRAVRRVAAYAQTEADAPALAAESDGAQLEVIPPGQEALLAQMLGQGAALPGDCRFTDGEANGSLVHATYACADGAVTFELHHPNDAPPGSVQTAHFALIVRSGSPPPGLTDALVSLIRSHESTFEWKEIAVPYVRPPLGRIVLPGAILLGIAGVGWILRRRRSVRLPPG